MWPNLPTPEARALPENPLLPNSELRALLHLTRRCALLDAAATRKFATQPPSRVSRSGVLPRSREALLAGSSLHLRSGDLLVAEAGDTTAIGLAPVLKAEKTTSVLPGSGLVRSQLLSSVAMAAGLRSTGADYLVLQYLRAGTQQNSWAEALGWAQQQLLPLILVLADASGTSAFRRTAVADKESLSWEPVRRAAAKLQLPVLTVDGEDAVAVYRVMQESALRARTGGGPAILWAMLPSLKDLKSVRTRSQQPVGRLERYLKSRKISF
ncbi:MAG: thiamine pyrophosphate-dependent enzyme [Janthinobacterium lividum]